MRDPHVEKLFYKLKTDESVSYRDPPVVVDETVAFKIRLEKDVLAVEMKEHHATEESAKQTVADYLDAWEIDVSLVAGRPDFHFVFERAEIIDRNPPPPGSVVTGSGTAYFGFTASAKGCVLKNNYPSPPTKFRASDAVRKMWLRYRMFLEGKEPQLSMAYACLTIIEGSTGLKGNQGARPEAARIYRVEQAVLKTLGELTSTKGGPEDARKFDAGATGIPLSDKEKRWMQEAVKKLIRRKAEYDHDPAAKLPEIKMSDLPVL